VKPREIRELDTLTLISKEKDLKEQLFSLRFQRVTGDVNNTSIFKMIRKDIARVKTIIRERQAAEAKSAVNKG
jgi:large subunit ribosomal protein L29